MLMFTIDYGTGVIHTVEGDLNDAKTAALEGMAYTQTDVKILNENGAEILVSHWYGVEPSEDDEVLAQFGSYGFYSEWQEGN
ncbi:hypothetical protein ELR57_07070 [Cohnella sp. AR92]|nr:hypothetical protein ELR57_07070 [Cohnella sp. AR92]